MITWLRMDLLPGIETGPKNRELGFVKTRLLAPLFFAGLSRFGLTVQDSERGLAIFHAFVWSGGRLSERKVRLPSALTVKDDRRKTRNQSMKNLLNPVGNCGGKPQDQSSGILAMHFRTISKPAPFYEPISST